KKIESFDAKPLAPVEGAARLKVHPEAIHPACRGIMCSRKREEDCLYHALISKREGNIAIAMPSSACNQRKKAAFSGGGSLPDEIIMEVLLRLPVKSILRFRAVCRSWAVFFSTEQFCNLHMATPKIAPLKLLFVSPTSRPGSTEVFSCSPSGPKDDLLFTLDSACGNSMQVVMPAPCHGLTLLFDAVAPAYYICNAATRAVTRLPPFRHSVRCTSTGLGFDAWTRKYKVVRLIKGSRHDNESVRCEVYTHGSGYGDCWRPPTGGIPFGLCRFAGAAVNNAAFFSLPPVFANGHLHWLVQPSLFSKKPRAAVISFSLAEETFSFVGPPPFWTSEMYSSTPLSASGPEFVPFCPGTLGEHLVQIDNQPCMVRDLRYNRNGGCILEIWKLPDRSSCAWSLNHRISLLGRVATDLRQPKVVRVIGSTCTSMSTKKILIATSMHKICDKFQKKVYTYDLNSESLETILSITEAHASLEGMNPSSRFSLFEESLAPVHETVEEIKLSTTLPPNRN
uniref:F-box domain-containing protein n=3 Tax=Aegilops tauschii TaxID=37682 RepID=A0A453QYD7_AEGTS